MPQQEVIKRVPYVIPCREQRARLDHILARAQKIDKYRFIRFEQMTNDIQEYDFAKPFHLGSPEYVLIRLVLFHSTGRIFWEFPSKENKDARAVS